MDRKTHHDPDIFSFSTLFTSECPFLQLDSSLCGPMSTQQDKTVWLHPPRRKSRAQVVEARRFERNVAARLLSFVPFRQILCKFTLPCCLAVYRCLGQSELPFRVLAAGLAGHTFFCTVYRTASSPCCNHLAHRRSKLVLFAQTRWSTYSIELLSS